MPDKGFLCPNQLIRSRLRFEKHHEDLNSAATVKVARISSHSLKPTRPEGKPEIDNPRRRQPDGEEKESPRAPARRSSREAMRFAGIRLENWRNFRRADVDLQRRVILVGPNASGKSNFLDAIRFLHDVVSAGGLQEAVRSRGGVSSIRSLAARRYSDVTISVRIGHDEPATSWYYQLSLAQDNLRRPLVKKEIVRRGAEELLSRPTQEDERDSERLTQTYLEQVNVNREFRSVSDFFGSVAYLHIVPQLIRDPDRSVGRTNDPFGGDFLEQIAKTPEKTRQAWFRRMTDALRVAVPQLKELELWRDVRGTPHIRGKYEHWRSQGAWQTEERFSDGTLRLMGLLWAALQGSGPLLLEEPELSLHPDVVRHIPQMLARMQRRSGRQVMISTHSPELLQDRGIGLDEVLLLTPEHEGTSIRPAAAFREIPELLAGGLTLAEAVIPPTRPAGAEQLAAFGE